MSVHYDKMHDIRRLIKLCQTNSIELPNQIEELVNLNPFAVEGRYGVIADDMYDAQTFIDLLQKVKSHVANKIGKVVACTTTKCRLFHYFRREKTMAISITIPENVLESTKIPRSQLKQELLK